MAMRTSALLAALATSALAASAMAAPPALAGGLEIMPILVTMIGEERTATVAVHNVSAAPVNIQIRSVDWAQVNGVEELTPSDTLLVSPPFVALEPDETQTFRLVVEGVADVINERSYRLLIDEIPNDATDGGQVGVQVALRVLIPVFLAPSTSARPSLQWSAERTAEGLVVTALNNGVAHERLDALSISVDGQAVAGAPAEGGGGYVLSQATRIWTFPGAPTGATVTVMGQGGDGAIEANVPIGP